MTNLQIWSDFAKRLIGAPALPFVYGGRHPVFREIYCPTHSHRGIEIVYHPKGRGVTRLNGERAITFQERSVIIYAPDEVHDQEVSCEGEDMCVQVSPLNIQGPLPTEALHIPQVDDPILIEEIRGLTQQGPHSGGEHAIYSFRATAVLLALLRVACEKEVRQKASLAEQRVLLVEEYIRGHFATITSLSEVSDRVGTSPDFLRHSFKKLRLKSIIRYLNEVRIERVKELLTHSKLSLKQIAPICGFSNEYYLATVFRQLVGIVPGQYRRNLSSKKGQPENAFGIRSSKVTTDPK